MKHWFSRLLDGYYLGIVLGIACGFVAMQIAIFWVLDQEIEVDQLEHEITKTKE